MWFIMQAHISFRSGAGGFAKILAVGTVVLLFSRPASPDFWTLNKQPAQIVKIVGKLPPVAMREGKTVRFEPEIAGQSIPANAATALRARIQTLLQSPQAGGIQLVDGAADTVIKCIITGYEQRQLKGDRDVGNKHEQIVTWIGNIEASVQVLDSRSNPLDSANIKYHLENDFVAAEQEKPATGRQEGCVRSNHKDDSGREGWQPVRYGRGDWSA